MRRLLFFFFVISITVGTAAAQAPGEDLDDLYARFINPAKEFRPRVWWHWMNGNVTKEGINEVEIRVTDSWANRLIGDARKRPEDRLTYTVKTFYPPEDEPLPSGLVGPVRLLSER